MKYFNYNFEKNSKNIIKMKKRFLLITSICLLVSFTSFAQNYEWAQKYSNSSANKEGRTVTTDTQNNCIVGGVFQGSVDVDPGVGQTLLTSAGLRDGFVSKIDQNGNLIWATSFGDATDRDNVYQVACDANDNVYIVGSYEGSIDADPSSNIVSLTSVGAKDMFIIKLDANGNYLWSKSYGSWLGNEEAYAISVTPSNDIVVIGTYRQSINFDPGNTDTTLTSFSGEGFVLKLTSSGNFSWVRGIGANLKDVVVESNNNIYVLANFSSTIYCGTDTLYPFVPSVNSSATDVAVIKLDNIGQYIWAKNIVPGYFSDGGLSIAVDNNSNVYSTGYFAGKVDFNPSTNPADTNYLDTDFNNNGSDIFVSKLNSNGMFQWAHKFGSTGLDEGYGIAIENNANVVIAGSIGGIVDLDPSINNYYVGDLIGNYEPIKFNLDLNGNFVKASEFTSNGHSSAFAVALGNDGSVYLTGRFNNDLDCNPDSNSTSILSAIGTSDIFIVKLKDVSTDIQNINNLSIVKIYPNPGTNKINISLPLSINNLIITRIYNHIGEEVYFQKSFNNETVELNVDLPSGIYFIDIDDGKQREVLKWVRK